LNQVLSGFLQDHALIQDAFHALKWILKPLKGEDRITPETTLDFLEDLQFFIEDTHLAKEESLLFPWLIARGVKDRGGQVAAMMVQHIQARGLLHNLIESLSEGEENVVIARHAEKFMACMTAHIQSEEETLLPMADGLMELSDETTLKASFEKFTRVGADLSSIVRLRQRVEEIKLFYTGKP